MNTGFKDAPIRCAMLFATLVLPVFCDLTMAQDTTGDALLNMLPSDCLVCVRINNFQTSLGALDQYLAGASPVPVSLSMMATMQTAAIAGDPMLTGLDMQGTFAMVLIKLPESAPDELFAVFLVPLADEQTFMKENKNLSPDTDGLFTLAASNSPVGKLAVLPLAGQKYIAVSRAENRKELLGSGRLLKDKKASLAGGLDAAAMKKAVAEPAWAYCNIAGLSGLYKEDIEEGFGEAAKGMTGLGGNFQAQLKAIIRLSQKFMTESDRLTVSLRPSAQLMVAEVELAAKADTDIAKMLVRDPMVSDGFTLADRLDEPAGTYAIAKMNKNCMRKFYCLYIDTLATVPEANIKPEDVDRIKSLISRGMRLMGDEMAYSFSYIAGKPPFELAEVVAVKDGAAFRKLIEESLTLPEVLTWGKMQYKPGIETYKNVPIDTLSLEMPWPDMPGQDPNLMAQTMGKSLEYYSACGKDKLFISAGPKAMEKLKAMIDQSDKPAGQPTGDVATALKALENSDKADIIAAINIIRLVKGASDMSSRMVAQTGIEIPDFWKDIDATTTSCLAAGGYLGNGAVSLRLALPKEHLAEIVRVFMQVQQKQMEYYQKQSAAAAQRQKQQVQPRATEEPEEPLAGLIGKAAPEMKMKDLSGNEISLSGLRGRPVLLEFWATWCPPCREQIPNIIELRKAYKNEQLAIIGISSEPAARIKKFADKTGINYTLVSLDADLPAPFDKVESIPTTFFIDAEGVIRSVGSGYHELSDLKASVEKIIKKASAEQK